MKKYLFFFILSCSCMNAQTYNTLLGNTNSWHYILNMYGIIAPPPKGGPSVNSQPSIYVWADPDLFADYDSVYQAKTWKALTWAPNSYTYGMVREDSAAQKVWFVAYGDTSEILLYDFSIQTADSIYLNFYNHGASFGYQTGWYKVDSIVSKAIAAGMRRHFYLNNPLNPVNCASSQAEPLVWIESVGNPVHLLYPFLYDCGSWGPLNSGGVNYWYGSQLVCKSMNAAEVYHDNQISAGIQNGMIPCYGTFDSCHYTMVCGGVEEYDGLKELKLFPQPAADVLSLQFVSDKNEKAELSVCDITGRIVSPRSQLIFSEGDNVIPVQISGFENGFYFLMLRRENSMVKLKFVVQK
jgi:hypothetical protein